MCIRDRRIGARGQAPGQFGAGHQALAADAQVLHDQVAALDGAEAHPDREVVALAQHIHLSLIHISNPAAPTKPLKALQASACKALRLLGPPWGPPLGPQPVPCRLPRWTADCDATSHLGPPCARLASSARHPACLYCRRMKMRTIWRYMKAHPRTTLSLIHI